MNSDNVGLVILLVVGIVVLSNLAMYAWVHRSRGVKLDWLNNLRRTFRGPLENEDESLSELRKRVEELSDRSED